MARAATCTRASLTRLEDMAWSIDAIYEEVPGMRLTCAEAAWLWDLPRNACSNVLDYLVSVGRLEQDEDGRFFRPGMW